MKDYLRRNWLLYLILILACAALPLIQRWEAVPVLSPPSFVFTWYAAVIPVAAAVAAAVTSAGRGRFDFAPLIAAAVLVFSEYGHAGTDKRRIRQTAVCTAYLRGHTGDRSPHPQRHRIRDIRKKKNCVIILIPPVDHAGQRAVFSFVSNLESQYVGSCVVSADVELHPGRRRFLRGLRNERDLQAL